MIETERIGPLLLVVPEGPEPQIVDLRPIARRVLALVFVSIPVGLALRAGLGALAARGDVAAVTIATVALFFVFLLSPLAILFFTPRFLPPRPDDTPPEAILAVLSRKLSSPEFGARRGWLWREAGALRFGDPASGVAACLTADAIREVRGTTLYLAVPEGWPPLRLGFFSLAKDACGLEALVADSLAPGSGSVLPALWREPPPPKVIGAWLLGAAISFGAAVALAIFGPQPLGFGIVPRALLTGLVIGPGMVLLGRSRNPERARAVGG